MYDYVMILVFLIAIPILMIIMEFSETSIVGASISRLESMYQKNNTSVFLKKHSISVVFTLLIIQQLNNFVFNFLLSRYLVDKITNHVTQSLIGLLISLVLIYVGMIFKSMAILNPEKSLKQISNIICFFYYIFYPISIVLEMACKQTLKFLRIDHIEQNEMDLRRIEIKFALNSKFENKENEDLQILKYALNMKEIDVDQIMTHRSDFILLDVNINKTYEYLKSIFLKDKIIIFEEHADNILGIIDTRNLLLEMMKDVNLCLRPLIQEPIFILTTTNVFNALQIMKKNQTKILLVIDEYGTIVGLITLSDILREIIGEIEVVDEYFEKNGNTYILDGNYNIRVLNRKMNWNIPDEDITISSLLINLHEGIPDENVEFIINNLKMIVLKTQKNKIKTVKIIENDNKKPSMKLLN